jgi:hypothetical protein
MKERKDLSHLPPSLNRWIRWIFEKKFLFSFRQRPLAAPSYVLRHVSMPSSHVSFMQNDGDAVFCCSFVAFEDFCTPYASFLHIQEYQNSIFAPI